MLPPVFAVLPMLEVFVVLAEALGEVLAEVLAVPVVAVMLGVPVEVCSRPLRSRGLSTLQPLVELLVFLSVLVSR